MEFSKNRRFVLNARVHTGIELEGRKNDFLTNIVITIIMVIAKDSRKVKLYLIT
jgi:hypothetical protein